MTGRIEHLSPETVVVAKGLVAGTVNLALGMAFAEGATAALTFGPFIGVAIAWLALDDRPNLRSITALTLAALGVALSMNSDHEHGHRHEPTRHDHDADAFTGRHSHVHEHPDALVHTHPHLPDIHHFHS